MKVWRAVLVMLLMVSVGSALFIAPARAQSGNCDYPRVWDFSAGDYAGWTVTTGNITASGVEAEWISGYTKAIDMSLMCAAPVGNPRQFLYGYWSSDGWTAPRPYNVYLLDENGDQIGGALGGGSGASGYGWFGWSGNWSAVYGFRIYYQRGGENYTVRYWEINHTTPVPTATPVFTSTPTIAPVPSGDWAYPATAAARDITFLGAELDFLSRVHASPFSALTASNESLETPYSYFLPVNQGYQIHAVVAGTVQSVSPLSPACARGGNPECFLAQLPSGYNLYLKGVGTSVVAVELGDGRVLKYVVDDPAVYEGQALVAGCIVGTAPLLVMSKNLGNRIDVAYAFVQGYETSGDMFDLDPYIGVEPSPRRCTEVLGGDCALVADPRFTNDPRWQTDPDPLSGVTGRWEAGGSYALTGTIWQDIALDAQKEYSIHLVYTRLTVSAHRFFVRLGTGDPLPVFDSAAPTQQQLSVWIPSDTYTPNDPATGLYSFAFISESGLDEPDVRLDFACIYDEDTGDPQPPGGCLLFNHEFDQQDFWAKTAPSGGGPAPSFQSGLSIMVDEASISQALKLSPKESGPQGYILSVYARRAGTNSGEQNIDLTWEWGSEGGTLEGYLSGPVQEVRDTFTVSLSQSNDLILTVDATDSPSVSTLHIDRVCILTEDGVKPPGYLDPPPIIASCKLCAYVPTGDLAADLNEFVGWLGCLLTQLWDCHLKTVLLGIWTTVTNILIFLGHMRLWLSLTLGNIAVWFNSNLLVVARWLEGTLKNIAAQIYLPIVIRDDGKGFWDVISDLITYGVGGFFETIRAAIDNLGALFSQLLGGVFGLAAAIISVLGALIGMVINAISGLLLTVIGSLVSIIIAFINGMNAVPAAAPDWIPNCADPGMGDLICYGFYMLDTEFQTGTGSILLAVIIGLASLDLLVWAVGRFMRVFGGD